MSARKTESKQRKRKSRGTSKKIAPPNRFQDNQLHRLSKQSLYTGNSQHKRYPEDYKLTPPASPRPGKTLCDGKRRIRLKEAKALLRQGFIKGMVSARVTNGWPEHVWLVTEQGDVFEATLENQGQGHYHGYPLQENDDFREIVLSAWNAR